MRQPMTSSCTSPADTDTSGRQAWSMIVLFGLLVGANQMMVLNFAPLVTTVQTKYGVGDLQAGLLTLMNPVTYLIFGFHAGSVLDHHGFKKVVSWAAAVMTIAAGLRCLELGYWPLLSIQTVIAASGVYITSAVAKLVSDWIGPSQTGLATGVVMALMLLGTGVGMGATPFFVESIGWQATMISYALVSVLITAVFFCLAKERQHSVVAADVTGMEEAKALIKDPQMRRVLWLSFLIIGATNGFNAWFEKIMSGNGFSPTDAGIIIGIALIVSVVGATLMPAISDKLKRRQPFILVAALFGVVLTYPFLSATSFPVAAGFAAAAGLLQLPSYILLVALSAEFAGQARAGLANSLVMITNSLGGLLIALLMERVGQWFGWDKASLVLIAVYLLSLGISLRLGEPEQLTTASQ